MKKRSKRDTEIIIDMYSHFIDNMYGCNTIYDVYQKPSLKKVKIFDNIAYKFNGCVSVYTHNDYFFTVFCYDNIKRTLVYIAPTRSIEISIEEAKEIYKNYIKSQNKF